MDEEKKEIKKEDATVEPIDELKKCETERDEYLNGWKRAKADYSNFQKDESRRLEEAMKFGMQGLIKELITVLDSFDLALGSMEVEKGFAPSLSRGVYMIRGQLEDVMKKFGLSRVNVEVGKMIDHTLHEAMFEVDADSPPGTIIEELERGYMLHGRVIRPARVKIAK